MEKDVMPEISLVIPMYNEGTNVAKVINRSEEVFQNIGYSYEIVIINDGSKDDTLDRVLKYVKRNDRIRVFTYSRNIGKGHAVKSGFMEAKGTYVVFLDGDLEISPNQIGSYILALKDSDLVIASKNHPNSKVIRPVTRKYLSIFFNYLVRLLFDLKVRDTQSGLKAVRKKSLDDVFSMLAVKRFAFDVELLAISNLYGLRISEMPIKMTMIKTSFNPKEIFFMLIDLMGIKYRIVTGKYSRRMIDGTGYLEDSVV